jgi:3-oxoacyl-[acyl-carrier-protein] synthase-3
MKISRILGTGHYVPEKVVTNDDMAKIVETSDEWIRTRTGIQNRRVVKDDEATSDLAVRAAKNALEAAKLSAKDIDLIVLASITPDTYMPAGAVYVQAKLGTKCPAFDISAACAGWSYGMTVTDGLLRSGAYKKVLFIGAECLTRVTNWNDRTTCVLFGDGAGAVVMTAEDIPDDTPMAKRHGLLATSLGCDGTLANELIIHAGGSRKIASAQTVAENQHTIYMNGRAIFSNAVRLMSESAESVLEQAGLTARDVDWVIPHQANLRIIEAIAKRLDLPMAKVAVNIQDYGNTSSASIPIALDQMVKKGQIKKDTLILMTGLGGGLAWGAVLYRW